MFRYATQTKQLERINTTCNLLRSSIRVKQLSAKLVDIDGSGGLLLRDPVKASSIAYEWLQIVQDTDLKGIHYIRYF